MQKKSALVEKIRLDALTDGVFAVAMTLLALSLVQPKYAMWVYLLNIFAPAVRRLVPNPKAQA